MTLRLPYVSDRAIGRRYLQCPRHPPYMKRIRIIYSNLLTGQALYDVGYAGLRISATKGELGRAGRARDGAPAVELSSVTSIGPNRTASATRSSSPIELELNRQPRGST